MDSKDPRMGYGLGYKPMESIIHISVRQAEEPNETGLFGTDNPRRCV